MLPWFPWQQHRVPLSHFTGESLAQGEWGSPGAPCGFTMWPCVSSLNSEAPLCVPRTQCPSFVLTAAMLEFLAAATRVCFAVKTEPHPWASGVSWEAGGMVRVPCGLRVEEVSVQGRVGWGWAGVGNRTGWGSAVGCVGCKGHSPGSPELSTPTAHSSLDSSCAH